MAWKAYRKRGSGVQKPKGRLNDVGEIKKGWSPPGKFITVYCPTCRHYIPADQPTQGAGVDWMPRCLWHVRKMGMFTNRTVDPVRDMVKWEAGLHIMEGKKSTRFMLFEREELPSCRMGDEYCSDANPQDNAITIRTWDDIKMFTDANLTPKELHRIRADFERDQEYAAIQEYLDSLPRIWNPTVDVRRVLNPKDAVPLATERVAPLKTKRKEVTYKKQHDLILDALVRLNGCPHWRRKPWAGAEPVLDGDGMASDYRLPAGWEDESEEEA